jgi:hypothetical protein
MLIQWEGSAVDMWLSQKEGREPTVFEICSDCYEAIVCGHLDPEKLLSPTGKGEPQDKYLYISEYQTQGKCEICKGRC